MNRFDEYYASENEVELGAIRELEAIREQYGVPYSTLLLYIKCDYSNIYLTRGQKLHIRNLMWLAGMV